jgi:hypothetical protein
MAFQVSPGIEIKEIDLSNVVPAVSSTVGAFAGVFQWGPVDEVKTVSSGLELVEEFYQPANTDAGSEDFYTADSFLRYGSALKVVRMATSGLFSANDAGATASLLKNEDDYEENYRDGSLNGTVGKYIAKYAGALGNSLKVSVCASSNAYFHSGVDLVNDANADLGDTIVTVDDGTKFVVRDIIKFSGHATKYRITGIGSNDLTIASLNTPTSGGLTSAVADDESIDKFWEFHDLFDKAPGTSASASLVGASNDEIHLVIVDEDGLFTGTQHTVLETFGFLSLASDGKDAQGQSNYYVNVLERESEYVYWSGHDVQIVSPATDDRTLEESKATPFLRPDKVKNSSLSGGANGRSKLAGDFETAMDKFFADSETESLDFIIVGSTRTDNGAGTDQDLVADHNTIVNKAIQIAELRKDCLVVASPRKASIVHQTSESTQLTNVKTDYASVTSSSYAVLDSGWIYQYDRYNDKFIWVPGNGHTAGLMARSDLLQDPWYSPAGFSRGQYLGITKLAFNPKKASRDELYRARINPIVTFPGQGTVLFGDKTALTVPSAFDRINVRRLFIVLERAVALAAKAQLFEFNDAFTRAQFRSAVEPFLRDVKNRRGLVDFSVVCDETNNTDSVIDRNEFVCSIFIKPAKSINFITLNFVASRSGVEFEELYGAV